MASITPGAAEANVFEDLSGNPISQSTNPYDALIIDCQNDPVSHLPLILLLSPLPDHPLEANPIPLRNAPNRTQPPAKSQTPLPQLLRLQP